MNCATLKDLQICWDCWAKDLFKAKFCFWIRNNLLLVARSYKLNTIELLRHSNSCIKVCQQRLVLASGRKGVGLSLQGWKSVGKSCNFGCECVISCISCRAAAFLVAFLWNNGCVWKILWLITIFHPFTIFIHFPWGVRFPFSGTPKIILVGDKYIMVPSLYSHDIFITSLFIDIPFYSIPFVQYPHSIPIRLYIYINISSLNHPRVSYQISCQSRISHTYYIYNIYIYIP